MREVELTYQNGQFIYKEAYCQPKILNFQEANRFKEFADSKAAKILNRLFIKKYPLTASLPDFLDPNQKEGVKWILTRSRSYLAHAPGAGKTLQAIAASILCGDEGQTLFITPPTLTENWKREIMLWALRMDIWPSVAVMPRSDKEHEMDWSADFIICPDSMITKDWVRKKLQGLNFKFIAVDEASRFKEAESNRTIALFGGELNSGVNTRGLISKARYVVLMDGSPRPNRSMELWAPTFAMMPEAIDFKTREEFGLRYCAGQINKRGEWEFKGDSHEEELGEKLQKSFMHVVTEKELNHPERLRSLLYMNYDARSPEQRSWERKNLGRFNFSDISENMSQGHIARFRRELGIRKAPWVADYVSDRLKMKNESILVFAWHRDVVYALAEKLKDFKPGVILGGTKNEEREKFINEFQAGKRRLLILNIAAAGRGHNLPRADRCIFAEWGWNDEVNKQCEKRASRKGRSKTASVRCDYIVAPASLDEITLKQVFDKARGTERILGT